MEGEEPGADCEEQEKIVAFMEIVGKPANKAREFLQATNWKLEEAIQLFYAGDEFGTTPKQDHAPAEVAWKDPAGSSDSGLKPVTSSATEQGDDYVRPPLPVKREALYEDVFEYRAQHMAQTSNQPSSVDAFRNFQDEANFRAHAPTNGVTSVDGNKDSLAALYRPPFALMFQGSFEQAKVEAAKQGKWLLINLQSTKEFSSYTLNRDTWAHETVKDMIHTVFIFWQVYDDTEEGRKVCTYYKLTNMPTIMILDPLTGQKMRAWEGMVGAERLLEDLVPYMDKGPLEQKQISFPPPKRPRESSYVSAEASKAMSNTDEDEELRLALAASLHDTREQSEEKEFLDKNSIVFSQDGDMPTDKSITHSKQSYPPLPEEPPHTDATICRVAVRFPDGNRGQRRFLRSDPIQLLWSFCLSQVMEAADGRSFRLTNTIPGVGGGVLDYEMQASIGDAGLANSMLVMTWD